MTDLWFEQTRIGNTVIVTAHLGDQTWTKHHFEPPTDTVPERLTAGHKNPLSYTTASPELHTEPEPYECEWWGD